MNDDGKRILKNSECFAVFSYNTRIHLNLLLAQSQYLGLPEERAKETFWNIRCKCFYIFDFSIKHKIWLQKVQERLK